MDASISSPRSMLLRNVSDEVWKGVRLESTAFACIRWAFDKLKQFSATISMFRGCDTSATGSSDKLWKKVSEILVSDTVNF